MNIRLKIIMIAMLVGSQGCVFGAERNLAPGGGEQSSARDSFEISDAQRGVASRVNSASRASAFMPPALMNSIPVRGGARRDNARVRKAQRRDLLGAENAALLEINAKLMQDNVALGDALYQAIEDNVELHRRLDQAFYGNENDNKASSASRGARSHSQSPRDYSERDRRDDRDRNYSPRERNRAQRVDRDGRD
jgi:hypothetical protein